MTTSSASSGSRIINPLTGVRGFAAIWVVLYHLRPTIRQALPDWSPFLNFVDAGYLGVDLFSFLSGFIISYTYSERLRSISVPKIGRYLWLRFVRTYPLHLFVLFLFVLVFVRTRGFHSLAVIPYDMSFVRQLFLLNGLGFEDRWAWNVPSWSLSSEWFCYLCFPLLVPAIMRVKSGVTALFLAASTLTITAMLLTAVGRPQFDAFLDWGLLRITGEFFTGCFLYRAYSAGIFEGRFAGMIGLASIIVFVVKVSFYPALPVLIAVAAFAVLIYSLAFDKQPLSALFGNRISVYVGKISYSIYMIHWLFLADLSFFGFDIIPLEIRAWFVLGVVLICSVISYEFVERTSRRAMRDLVLAQESHPAKGNFRASSE